MSSVPPTWLPDMSTNGYVWTWGQVPSPQSSVDTKTLHIVDHPPLLPSRPSLGCLPYIRINIWWTRKMSVHLKNKLDFLGFSAWWVSISFLNITRTINSFTSHTGKFLRGKWKNKLFVDKTWQMLDKHSTYSARLLINTDFAHYIKLKYCKSKQGMY